MLKPFSCFFLFLLIFVFHSVPIYIFHYIVRLSSHPHNVCFWYVHLSVADIYLHDLSLMLLA